MLNKKISKRILSVVAAVALTIQCFMSPVGMQTVQADTTPKIEELITQFEPKIVGGGTSKSGLTHPGVGLTEELLNNVQTQVREQKEPWKTYFEDMLESSAAKKDVTPSLEKPGTSQLSTGALKADGLKAYTQAILYYVTGDSVYRKNTLNILRTWAEMKPENYKGVHEGHIHTGIATNRMCIAAEIMRYSSYDANDAELKWTDEEIQKFIDNFVAPIISECMSSEDHFMNQHNYSTLGAMSGYLFMDDVEGYNKTVEWFTVNKEGDNPGFNGSIERLFRKITHLDVVGQKEGTGTPLTELPEYEELLAGKDYVIQHVEMGRDNAHGCGDLTNAAIMARMMMGQGTKVDPTTGEPSTAPEAEDIYQFLDDRLLVTADFLFKYMLGYDDTWVPTPFSIRDIETDDTNEKVIAEMYPSFSPEYRGRYQTINFWDFYTHYKYNRKGVDLKTEYPYFYEGFMKKVPSNWYYNGGMFINWDNGDGGGDFWLFLPAEAANDAEEFIAEPQVHNLVEVETRGSLVANKEAMSVTEDEGVKYVRFAQSGNPSKLAIHSGGTLSSNTIAFRIRTDGMATLSLSNGVSGSIHLPDTEGEWQYVTFTKDASENFSDLYYVIVSDMEGNYVDIDAIDIKPGKSNGNETIVLDFESGNDDVSLVTYTGAPLSIDFTAKASKTGLEISYAGVDLPDGATVNASGELEWTPSESGNYNFYMSAATGETSILKKVEITVAANRSVAIQNAISEYNESETYISATLANYKKVLEETEAMVSNGTDDTVFAAQLNKLCEAVEALELVSPKLTNDPYNQAGDSLDFASMAYDSTMKEQIYRLTDGMDTYVEYTKSVAGAHIIDFGPDFKVSVTNFAFKSRLGFADRLAGVQVFGSNDKKTWTTLTIEEAEYDSAYQTVAVKEEEKENQYRYLKIQKTTEYRDALRGEYVKLLEIGEMRIWGTRYEIGNMIESVSMSSEDAVNGRVEAGDTVTLEIKAKEAIKDVEVTIQGETAEVTTTDNIAWIANAKMTEESPMGKVEITIDYKKEDDSQGGTFYETTDGSSFLLVDSGKKIDVLNQAKKFDSTNPSRSDYTPEQNTKFLFDGVLTDIVNDKRNFGEVKARTDYYMVDFGVGIRVNLEAVLIMPRNDQGGILVNRTNGMMVSGSNDGKNWTQITNQVSDATYLKWSMLSGDDLIDKKGYRYFKINGAEWGNAEEIEFYGTLSENNNIESISISSEDADGGRVEVGDTVTLDIKGKVALEDVTATFYGADVSGGDAGDDDATTWTVSTEVTEEWTPGNVEFAVTYKDGDNYNETTDGSYLFIMDTDKYIDVANEATITANGAFYDEDQIPGRVFDKNLSTYGDLTNDSSSYYMVDFGPGARITLESVLAMHRTDQDGNLAARINGMVVSGSINGVTWTPITNPVSGVTKDTKFWSLLEGDDIINNEGYRYFKISGAQYGAIAEIEFYGTKQEGFKIDSISISGTPERTDNKVGIGDTINLTVVGSEEFQSLTTTIAGKNVTAEKTDGYTWVASVEVTDEFEKGYVDFTVDYVDASGNPGTQCTETTDGSSLFIINTSKYIDVVENATVAATGRLNNSWTDEQCAGFLFDGDLTNFGEVANGTGYYTVDFGSGYGISLENVMFMPRPGFPSRLNRMIVSGSNDGINWTQLTQGVSGAVDGRWSLVQAEENEEIYRYLKISGGEYGDVAEVEIYGVLEEVSDEQLLTIAKTAATSALQGYVAEQSVAGDEAAAKEVIKDIVNAFGINGITVDVVAEGEGFKTATKGTKTNPDGTDGSYTFKVALSNEAGEVTTDAITIVIKATSYYVEIDYVNMAQSNEVQLNIHHIHGGGSIDDNNKILNLSDSPLKNLTDNNQSTHVEYRQTPNESPAHLTIDFTNAGGIKLANVSLQARMNFASRTNGVLIEVSKDGIEWETVGVAQGIADVQTFANENVDETVNFVKIYNPVYNDSNAEHYLSIAEFHLFGEMVNSFDPVPTGTPEPTTVPTKAPEPATAPTKAPKPTTVPTQAPKPTTVPTQAPEPTTVPTQTPEPTAAPVADGWDVVDGMQYWYEDGVLQGTEGRGKEIYDPATNAWYWLDSVLGGAVAKNKDVYQESEAGPWADRADGTGKWVRYDENGYMIKGWQDTEEGDYYFDQIYGTMAKGYATIEGIEYYFDEATGVLVETIGEVPENGWKEMEGNLFWYEGSMRQGFKVDDSYRGKEVYDPETDAWYWLDNVLGGAKAVSKDVYQDSFSAYPDQPDGTGKWVRYDENGRMVKGWQYTDAGTYYFEEVTGSMAKGHVTIDGQEYYFDEATGILQ